MYECPSAEHHTMLILGCCQVWTCGRALLEMSVCADGTVGMHTQKIMNEKHTLKELPWSLVMKDCTVSEEWIQQLKQIHFFFQWIVSSFTELCLKGWITPNNFVIICSAPCWQKVGWSSKSHKSFFGAPQQNRLSRILLNKWSRQWHVLKHKNMKLLQTSVQRNPSLLKPRDLKLIWKHNICAWSQVTSNQFKISGLLKTSAGFPSTCGRVDTDWCLILWWTCQQKHCLD